MDDVKKNVTWNELRFILPFTMALVPLIFFIASVSIKLDAVQLAQIDIKAQIRGMSDAQDSFKTAQAAQGLDIAVIKNILQHNNLSFTNPTKADGVLAMNFQATPTNVSSAQTNPTPVPTPVSNVKKNPKN